MPTEGGWGGVTDDTLEYFKQMANATVNPAAQSTLDKLDGIAKDNELKQKLRSPDFKDEHGSFDIDNYTGNRGRGLSGSKLRANKPYALELANWILDVIAE